MSRRIAVLVVEDDKYTFEELYKPALSTMDIDIDYAASEHDAIEMVRCRTYDAAYIDIMLKDDTKDRGGVEVIKHIFNEQEGTGMIVVSATDDLEVAINAYRAGIVDFLRKGEIRKDRDILAPLEKILSHKTTIQFPTGVKNTSFGYGLSSGEITSVFATAVQDEIAEKRRNRLPVARYDADKKQAYLENADGTREHVIG